jgi:hypothetical protein
MATKEIDITGFMFRNFPDMEITIKLPCNIVDRLNGVAQELNITLDEYIKTILFDKCNLNYLEYKSQMKGL